MSVRLGCVVVLAAALLGCGRESWPEPPAIDASTYQEEYEKWRGERQETAEWAVRVLGIWPLQDGETPFGADASLPIVLPATAGPPRAGVFRRAADKITVMPAPGAPLRFANGGPVAGPSEVVTDDTVLELGSVRLQVVGMGNTPERRFVSAWDEEHPALRNLPMIETYELDPRWRVAARFEAFDAPKPVKVPDVRGGLMEFLAMGQLIFRVNGQEHRLTAFGEKDREELFVMFRDATNGSTTYNGYRILAPRAVGPGEWTVLDFNLALNPPCAYSRFTTCPLPPPENRLQVAVEAGEKRHPSAQGYSE